MQQNAVRIDQDRHKRQYKEEGDSGRGDGDDGGERKDAKFLKDINRKVYMESEMKLEERLNRKAHYMDRHSTRD
jgi:hypothetical protein